MIVGLIYSLTQLTSGAKRISFALASFGVPFAFTLPFATLNILGGEGLWLGAREVLLLIIITSPLPRL